VNLYATQFWLKQRKVSSHSPSAICLFPISASISLPLQTLRLVSLVSLIIKTKRVAERSATNCDTHTDRQSTLDKYMIKNFGMEGRSIPFKIRLSVSYLTREGINVRH
jgi:hypothetical protein